MICLFFPEPVDVDGDFLDIDTDLYDETTLKQGYDFRGRHHYQTNFQGFIQYTMMKKFQGFQYTMMNKFVKT